MGKYTAIDDPSAHFQIATWTGNGADRNITNDGNSDLQPDFVWYKCLDSNTAHIMQTSNYGVTKYFRPNLTSAIGTASSLITSFNTDGFGISQYSTQNVNSERNVAWQWKANGNSTSSNTDGDITSTIQTNSTAGFTIGTYTGNGSNNQTIGHGLGARPNWIIVKRKDTAAAWLVWHEHNSWNHVFRFYTNGETDSASGRVGAFNNGSQGTSSIFTVFSGSGAYDNCNINGDEYIFWAWTEKQGYSKFGSYKGNSADDGTFVYLGFKPKWIMFKSTQANMTWDIMDTARSTSNVMDDYFVANGSDPQGSSSTKNIDFLSNGFKCRDDNNLNFSDHTYTYMAFAENPFVTSTGIMGTAR